MDVNSFRRYIAENGVTFLPKPDGDTLRVLISTDNHLGYCRLGLKLLEDPFTAFEEVFQLAQKFHVDLVLLSGDLFHRKNPENYVVNRTLQILRKYTLGENSVKFKIVSPYAQAAIFRFKNFFEKAVNNVDESQLDKYLPGQSIIDGSKQSVKIPVFSINGNHDSVAVTPLNKGLGISSLDILSSAGLVDYIGRYSRPDSLVIEPLALEKGNTRVLLYGMSNINEKEVLEYGAAGKLLFRPSPILDDDASSASNSEANSFRLLLVHQNRENYSSDSKVEYDISVLSSILSEVDKILIGASTDVVEHNGKHYFRQTLENLRKELGDRLEILRAPSETVREDDPPLAPPPASLARGESRRGRPRVVPTIERKKPVAKKPLSVSVPVDRNLEQYIPDLFDLIVWGHEHKSDPCPTPKKGACDHSAFTHEAYYRLTSSALKSPTHPSLTSQNKGLGRKGFVVQPGSTVATSFCQGESLQKHVVLAEFSTSRTFTSGSTSDNSGSLFGSNYHFERREDGKIMRIKAIPLACVREMILHEFNVAQHTSKLTNFFTTYLQHLNPLIKEYTRPHTSSAQPSLGSTNMVSSATACIDLDSPMDQKVSNIVPSQNSFPVSNTLPPIITLISEPSSVNSLNSQTHTHIHAKEEFMPADLSMTEVSNLSEPSVVPVTLLRELRLGSPTAPTSSSAAASSSVDSGALGADSKPPQQIVLLGENLTRLNSFMQENIATMSSLRDSFFKELSDIIVRAVDEDMALREGTAKREASCLETFLRNHRYTEESLRSLLPKTLFNEWFSPLALSMDYPQLCQEGFSEVKQSSLSSSFPSESSRIISSSAPQPSWLDLEQLHKDISNVFWRTEYPRLKRPNSFQQPFFHIKVHLPRQLDLESNKSELPALNNPFNILRSAVEDKPHGVVFGECVLPRLSMDVLKRATFDILLNINKHYNIKKFELTEKLDKFKFLNVSTDKNSRGVGEYLTIGKLDNNARDGRVSIPINPLLYGAGATVGNGTQPRSFLPRRFTSAEVTVAKLVDDRIKAEQNQGPGCGLGGIASNLSRFFNTEELIRQLASMDVGEYKKNDKDFDALFPNYEYFNDYSPVETRLNEAEAVGGTGKKATTLNKNAQKRRLSAIMSTARGQIVVDNNPSPSVVDLVEDEQYGPASPAFYLSQPNGNSQESESPRIVTTKNMNQVNDGVGTKTPGKKRGRPPGATNRPSLKKQKGKNIVTPTTEEKSLEDNRDEMDEGEEDNDHSASLL